VSRSGKKAVRSLGKSLAAGWHLPFRGELLGRRPQQEEAGPLERACLTILLAHRWPEGSSTGWQLGHEGVTDAAVEGPVEGAAIRALRSRRRPLRSLRPSHVPRLLLALLVTLHGTAFRHIEANGESTWYRLVSPGLASELASRPRNGRLGAPITWI